MTYICGFSYISSVINNQTHGTMKTTIWKSDLNVYPGLDAFLIFWKDDLVEYENFYIFSGNFNPYELEYVQKGIRG